MAGDKNAGLQFIGAMKFKSWSSRILLRIVMEWDTDVSEDHDLDQKCPMASFGACSFETSDSATTVSVYVS
jgi:hypothetical protein